MAAALAVAVIYQLGLLLGGSLHGFDWQVHYHYYDWIRTALTEHGTLPLFMVDAWHTPNFLANAQTPLLGPLVWLLAVLPTDTYIKLLIVLYTAVGLIGAFILARDLGARSGFAALSALVFALGGFFAAHVSIGHHWSLGTYLLPAFVLLMRRAIAGSRAAVLGAAAIDALCLLEGQHHPFLWQSGFVAVWAGFESVRRRDWAPVRTTLLVGVLALGLAGVRVLPVLAEFRDYFPAERIAGIPPSALLSSWLGASQGPDTVFPGLEYRHGSGWWEYAFYLGWPGLGFVAVGAAAAARRCWPLLATGALFGLLSLDTRALGFDVWEALQRLPVASSQRGPSRLMILALFAACTSAAVGWTSLLARARERWPALPQGAVSALLALMLTGVALDLVHSARAWQAVAVGAPQASRSHQLPPPRFPGGSVKLVKAEPNRLHYRVVAPRSGPLVFRLDWQKQRGQWRPVHFKAERSRGGRLAVRLPAGEHDVVLAYRPRGLMAGALLSAVALASCGGWWAAGRHRSRAETR